MKRIAGQPETIAAGAEQSGATHVDCLEPQLPPKSAVCHQLTDPMEGFLCASAGAWASLSNKAEKVCPEKSRRLWSERDDSNFGKLLLATAG